MREMKGFHGNLGVCMSLVDDHLELFIEFLVSR